MIFDYITLETLRTQHPAWRLLCSDHAPLIVSFLYRVFIAPNVRAISAADLAETLEDELFALRQQLGTEYFPKSAIEYLNDWASHEKGWVRKFYAHDSDEPQFDLTPTTEKVISWLYNLLTERSFIGTESRLLTIFDLLKQIVEGTETDSNERIDQLKKQRDKIDDEIAKVLAGKMDLLDETALKDRFHQFMQIAKELLMDFRELENNFRLLDRRVRERIALWEGTKGSLLEKIMAERDAITDSDQGRSFQAFWDFLMSSQRQEELSDLITRVLSLPAIANLKPDMRIRRVHYDWLEAGGHTQKTVAQLSQQLRRFLDNKVWLENRRIMDILHTIEVKALALRDAIPGEDDMTIAEYAADIELPMERPLYTPATKTIIENIKLESEDADLNTDILYSQIVVDQLQLNQHIRQTLQLQSQVTLQELIKIRPLKHGLAELIAYLKLSCESFKSIVDENSHDTITWNAETADQKFTQKSAILPRIIFMR